jgi:hypothetical protein
VTRPSSSVPRHSPGSDRINGSPRNRGIITNTEVMAKAADLRVGTAGWSIPGASASRFDSAGTHRERYSRRLDCAEINSSFHRPHAATTYAKWRDSTPAGFRFGVKMPRAITHELKLQDAREPFITFLAQTDGLADKRGPLLFQLPPSLSFDNSVVTAFLDMVRREYGRAHRVRAEARNVVLAACGIAARALPNITSGGRPPTGVGRDDSGWLGAGCVFSAARLTADVLVPL